MNPQPEFLPCPFCGGKVIERIDPDCTRVSGLVILHNNDCYFSACERPGVYPIAQWNRRSKVPPLDDHTSLTIWNALIAKTIKTPEERTLCDLLTDRFLERSR